jgi:RNA polymerase sigma-70 factor, ECF subfamily
MSGQRADAALVERARAGDNTAFNLLVLKYQHKIVQLVGRYVRDPSEAEDVTQEAFIKAYRALPRFRGDSAFYTWVYRIAINTAKNHLAAASRRTPAGGLTSADDLSLEHEASLAEHATPERMALAAEIQETLQAALHELPEDLCTAVTLRELEGMSYEDIATTMQCPIGTVRSRIFRAREAINRRLAPLLDDTT